MSEEHQTSAPGYDSEGAANTAASTEKRRGLPLWKKLAFAAALIVGLVGVGLTQAGNKEAAAPAGVAGSADGAKSLSFGPSSFSSGDLGEILGGESASAPADEGTPWGPFFMKGGLSFAIAFAVGYALRTFIKMTLVVAGLAALAIFGLQKAGIIGEIDWTVAQGYWDSLTANVGAQVSSFKSFLTGSLPSAGMGSVGLISGFRR